MDPMQTHARHLTRRQFFGSTGIRLGGVALALLAADEARAGASKSHPALPGFPHHKPTARSVIY
ncbi:MAG TPA: sulfatase, partial [Gemmataceae bacterium]|nr:sulfatase [Gemmataceae bacterium]